MRRFMVLVTVVLLMTAMLVASAAPALAVLLRSEPKCCRVSPPTACNTVAGVAGFEWRAGGTVCWLEAPAWELVQDAQDLDAG
jgi:hypothetical protein